MYKHLKRFTEHQNAINRHDHSSLPAKHTDDNGHKFDWSQTRCLGQATTRHAREFKEAWHSLDKQTFNRLIDIPTIYLQLKRSHKSPNSSSLTFNPPSTSYPTPSHDNNNHPDSIVTNGNQHTEIHQPIRRSHTLQQRDPCDEDSKYRVESSKQIITIRRALYNFVKIIIQSPSRRREAPCEGTNSPRLFTPGETKALAKSKVQQ